MSKESYTELSSGELYLELLETNKLHLIDDLVKDGWITPMQFRDIRALKEGLDDNAKMATEGISD